MTDLQEPQPQSQLQESQNASTPRNIAGPDNGSDTESSNDDMGIRILVVLVTMFVFMFIVALVGLFFVARR